MRDPKRGKLTEQLTYRIYKLTLDKLEKIIKKERRTQNEVARALLDRGIAAYERDGLLFEPEENEKD